MPDDLSSVLIVGLGNPGEKYQNTRHNFGFDVIDRLAHKYGAELRIEKKFNADLAKSVICDRKVILAKPLSFMNLSGPVVRKLASFYKVKLKETLIILDDANLPLGKLRMRSDGSDGGHHGLESVSKSMGSKNHPRLRLGIGRGDNLRQIAGFVLDKFQKSEAELKEKVEFRAVDQIEYWLTHNMDEAIQKFNGTVD